MKTYQLDNGLLEKNFHSLKKNISRDNNSQLVQKMNESSKTSLKLKRVFGMTRNSKSLSKNGGNSYLSQLGSRVIIND